MKQYDVEKNIDYYQPSYDEILLAEDTLDLIGFIFNCKAKWKNMKEMYARLSYGCVAMAVWEADGEEYYTHAWTKISGSEVAVSIGANILEVVTEQVFKYDKPFEHGQLIEEVVDFDNLTSIKEEMACDETNEDFVYLTETDCYEEEQEEDDFNKVFDSVFNLNPDNDCVIQNDSQNSYSDRAHDRYMEYMRDLQYAKSFKEQFGTDSTEMNEEVANTKFFFGALSDFFGF